MGLAVIVDSEELKAIRNELICVKEMLHALVNDSESLTQSNIEFISIPKAAKKAGVDKRTIAKAIEDGIIKASRTHNNGQRRISLPELERYILAKGQNQKRAGRPPENQNIS